MEHDHPIPMKIHEEYSDLIRDGKEIVFVWAPGHVVISGNSATDSAAKDALDGDVSDEYIPFSDLKPRLSNYIAELCQNEWDNYPRNKLPKISPKKNNFLTSCRSNRTEETVLSRLHIGHSYMTHYFLLKGDPPFCILSNESNSVEHVLLHCSDLTNVREQNFHANYLRMLFRNVSLDSMFDFPKESNVCNNFVVVD